MIKYASEAVQDKGDGEWYYPEYCHQCQGVVMPLEDYVNICEDCLREMGSRDDDFARILK